MQTATIVIDTDTRIENYGILYAGEYTIEMPDDYDIDLVTADDLAHDHSIEIISE